MKRIKIIKRQVASAELPPPRDSRLRKQTPLRRKQPSAGLVLQAVSGSAAESRAAVPVPPSTSLAKTAFGSRGHIAVRASIDKRLQSAGSGCATSMKAEHTKESTAPSCLTSSGVKRATPARQIDLEGPGYLRLADVLTVLAVSRATYYAKMKLGIYPASVALGPRARGWTRASIRNLLTRIEAGELSGS